MLFVALLCVPSTMALAAKAKAKAMPAPAPAQTHHFDAPAIGELRTVTTESKKDTLIDMAARYQIGYAQLLAANPGVDPFLPGANRKIILPEWHILPGTAREGILLNTAELRLYYFPPDGSEPRTFPIGIGREGLTTPLGTTTIVNKVDGPSWRPTPRMRLENPKLPEVVPPGPENPLGAYALYLGWPSYRIHGTDHEKAIGRRASSGCIRMYKADITWMYENVPVGTKVTSIAEPVKMAWIDDKFYLEAEPNDAQIDEIEYKNRQITVDIPDGIIGKIRQKAGEHANKVDWAKVRQVLVQRTGIPTVITE
ncbi:MAG: ErfK/YbiS/YcfS/YnhG like protein [Alphaproteobacteria bacterium]|nr:ErfK/YbiS/YcfS/YnhG like protein [Alphaproteobacteria bacterium]